MKISKIVQILLIVLATIFIMFANFSFWLNKYIFDTENFKEVSVNAILSEDSRNALSNEVVDELLKDRPLVEETIGPRLESLLSSLLDSPISRSIFEKTAETIQKQLTSKEKEPVTINTVTIKSLLKPLSEFLFPNNSLSSEVDKVPDNIVLLEKELIPSIYSWGSIVILLGPISFVLGIIIFIFLIWITQEKSWALKTSGLFILGLSLALIILVYLYQSAALAPITNKNAKPILENLYQGFSLKLIEQTIIILAFGVLLIILGYILNRRSTSK